ncbi:hypothetical protein ACLOAV_008379 [Pseudogymnoascus australis]
MPKTMPYKEASRPRNRRRGRQYRPVGSNSVRDLETLYEVSDALCNAPSDIQDLSRDLETFSQELNLSTNSSRIRAAAIPMRCNDSWRRSLGIEAEDGERDGEDQMVVQGEGDFEVVEAKGFEAEFAACAEHVAYA